MGRTLESMHDTLVAYPLMEDDRTPRIAEGFPGQRAVVLPRPVIASWLNAAPLLELSPSDVGHYPHARWHHRERPEGCPELIFLWCYQGEGWLTLADETFPVRAGQAAVIPPGVPHVYGADHASPWTIYWVHVVGPKVGEAQRLLGARPRQPILTVGQDPGLVTLFEQMLALLERGYSAQNLMGASLCLAQAVARVAFGSNVSGGGAETVEQRIESIISLMLSSLDRNLRVDELASHCKLSPSHFAALFKKRTGFSAIDFFLRLKMQRACRLLETSAMPIKEIAIQLGIDDPLYFSRSFHRIYACSPSEYRRHHTS
jgi:AraC-like DNA-binding protein